MMNINRIEPKKTEFPLELDDFVNWQKNKASRLSELLGLENYTTADHGFRLIKETYHRGFCLCEMEMHTEENILMPFFLLLPKNIHFELLSFSKRPLMILPHGHGSDGRYGTVGIYRHEIMEHQRNRYHHDIALSFAKQGYICLCPDSRGSGDRREPRDQGNIAEKLLSSSCNDLNNALISLGSCLAGAWVFDLIALIDMIYDNNWGDIENIGICGFSGGGLQALFTSAIDSRIKCTAVSGYFHRWEDCFLQRNLCGCNYIPGFHKEFNLAEVASLIAPRPLIIEKGTEDLLSGSSGIKGPRELAEQSKKAYVLYEKEEQFNYCEFKGEHRFDGTGIFPFMNRYLKKEIQENKVST